MGALHCRWYPCTRRFQDWDCGVMSVSVSVVQILRGGTNDNRKEIGSPSSSTNKMDAKASTDLNFPDCSILFPQKVDAS